MSTGNVNGGNNSGWVFAPTGYTITALNGTYSLTGKTATITYAAGGAYVITANSGSYALTGQTAAIYRSRSLTANSGSYALTGRTAAIYRSRLLSPVYGVYSLTGYAADISYAPAPPVTNIEYFIEIRSFTERRRI